MTEQLVMVTNQDSLRTDSFPEDFVWPAQQNVTSVSELMNLD